MFQCGDFQRIGDAMAGVETVEPFGEVGLEQHALLPLQHGPAGIKQGGEFGIDFQEIGSFPDVVIKLIDLV